MYIITLISTDIITLMNIYEFHGYLYKLTDAYQRVLFSLTSATLPGSISATLTGASPRTLNPNPWSGLRSRVTVLGADHSFLALNIVMGPLNLKIKFNSYLYT